MDLGDLRVRDFLHQYFFLLDTKARKKLSLVLFFCLISSLLDVIGIGLVGVFLALMINPENTLHYLPFSFNQPPSILHKGTLIYTAGILTIVAFISKALIGCFIQKQIVLFSYGYGLNLKVRLMKAFQYAPYHYHLKQNSSALVNRISQADIYTVGILMPSLTMAANLMIAIAIAALLFVVNPWGTLMLAGLCGAFILLNNVLLSKKITTMGKSCSIQVDKINKSIHHGLGGLKEIRILGQEQYFLQQMESAASKYARAMGVNAFYQLLPRYVIESVLGGFIILLCLGSLFLGVDTAEIISFVGVFAAAGARLLPTMTQLTAGINQLRFSGQVMSRIYYELKELEELNQQAIPIDSSEKLPFSNITLQDISFSYPEGKQSALSHLNLTLRKGQSIGLIGASGAGKSTLVNLLLGFLHPKQGRILIDGQPINNMRNWVNNFAYIPQHIFLLDDTVKNNIAFGIEEHQIDLNQLKSAIRWAQLESVIDDLPEGINTLIGENGVRLSGGQRQRVALARTFYHDRDIIIMDEATSALDNETEREITNSIKELHGIKTLIVIAHRLSTVEHCDIICKLEKGRVIQLGSFQDVVGLIN